MDFCIRQYLLSIFAAIVLFIFIACARPAPIVVPPPAPPKLTQEEIIKALKENALRFTSLKSYVKTKIEYPEKEKLKKQSFDGALLYKKGNEILRFQAFGALGRTIFDLLCKQSEITLYIPSSAVVFNGVPNQIENVDERHFFLMLSKIIPGMEERYDAEQYTFNEDDDTLWVDNGRQKYSLKVNRQTLLVDKKTIIQDGQVIVEIFYGDYEHFNETLFPTHMKMVSPSQRITIEFDFDSPVLNENLPDRLFSLSLSPDTTWLPLSNLRLDLFL